MEGDSYCLECKQATEIVVDNMLGDTICTECGLVLETWNIQGTMEWRTFSDDNNKNNSSNRDPNRVGKAENPLLNYVNLITHISDNPKPSDASKCTTVLPSKRLHDHDPDGVLIRRLKIIADMADRLALPQTIEHRAGEIYKFVEEHRICGGRKLDAVLAACLSIACRESKLSRTLKEFTTVVPNGVREKEINKAVVLIRKRLDVQMGAVQASEYVKRFCSYLGIMKNKKTVQAVHEAVDRAEELDIRTNPKSVLAAIIYMIIQVSDDKKSLGDISIAAKVAESTIKKSYEDLYPYASRIIPNWFANEEDIDNKLCDLSTSHI
ncbi:hypothetical protein Ddye_025255 [Dipteronia dyeriana]|uniref:TFIIB-type domain-containing protein n=1 Tax=Dipteronia dyeriana TaxID=168575 RepID=A0AAD9TWH8_9ROSI|nr:hypothetical protein Ddye_025255 [Dipteronia dyeriana]